MNKLINKEQLKQWLIILLIILLGTFLLYYLRDFVTAFLGALIFYVLFRPFMKYLVEKRKWKPGLSAILIILLSFIIILVPITALSMLLYSEARDIIDNPATVISSVEVLDKFVLEKTGVEIFSDELIMKARSMAANFLPALLNEMFSILGLITIMYFLLYYLLRSSGQILAFVRAYSPFSRQNTLLFTNELKSQTFSNALAVPVLAVLQGLVAALGFWFFDLEEPMFWGSISGFFSFVPIVGTAIVWIPAGLVQLINGAQWQGIGILLYGILVISNIDNVFRFMLQKRFADVHPIVTVFGVIVGLRLFSIPGIVFGPLLISYFTILLKIYWNEYLDVTEPEENN